MGLTWEARREQDAVERGETPYNIMSTKDMVSCVATTVISQGLPHHGKGPQEERLWVQFSGKASQIYYDNPQIDKNLFCRMLESDPKIEKSWSHMVRCYHG